MENVEDSDACYVQEHMITLTYKNIGQGGSLDLST
jgi:hypothetical protein